MKVAYVYLPDFGEVREANNLERCILRLAPELDWQNIPDEERAWWDELGNTIADMIEECSDVE